MANLRFTYLYRDGSNYKSWAEIVFSNPAHLDCAQIYKRLSNAFLEDGLFIADQIRVPEVFLSAQYGLSPDDHCYHEFDSVEPAASAPNDALCRTIEEFLSEVEREAHWGWKAFTYEDRFPRRDP